MSMFQDFWKGLKSAFSGTAEGNGLALGNSLQSLWKSLTGAGLTGAQQEANAFSADQAQIEREWQEKMRGTNFQAQVADMQAAGLNPALMYQSGAGSSTPSGASASSVAPSAASTLSEILQMGMFKASLAKTEAETKNIEAQTK